jgi:hypothetical protein
MSKVQLYAVNNIGETVLLQLSDDSPIKMNLSVAEINPFTPSSFFSQTFRLPGIGQNTRFFQDVYSVNGTSFNPAAAAQAWILSDGALFSIGNLNIQAVYTNNRTGSIEYEVYFLGDTSDLATSIGEQGMNTIDASELNHSLSYANVTASWAATGGATAGLKDGNVLYPLCEWGYTYGTGAADKNLPVENTLSVSFNKSFTVGPTGALKLEQMKPATRIKWLFDKILSDAGYTYTSEFLDSDYFGSLYMISDSVARPTFSSISGTCEITISRSFAVPVNQTRIIPFDIAITNSDQAFNTTTNTFTAPTTGSYTFSASGDARTNSPIEIVAFKVLVFKNNVSIYESGVLTNLGDDVKSWTYSSGTLSLTQGDIIDVRIQQMPFSVTTATFFNTKFNCLTGPNQVVMSSFFPDDTILKKIDFLRSIIRMFNLVFEPSRVTEKSFVIEPWIDWVLLGEIKDWTKYFDGSSDLQSSPVFFDQQRTLKFKGAPDADFLNKRYQDQNKADYMYRQFDSGIKLIKGSQDIEVQFAATPLQSIPSRVTQYPNWVFPSLGRIQPGDPDQPGSGQMQPIVPIPRCVHYNGLQSNPIPWYLNNGVSGGGTGQTQNTYPLVSNYSSWPPDQFETVNLNFLSKQALWSSASTYIGQTSRDLYTDYWSEYVDWIYDPFNRKVKLTLRIDPADVLGFSFNDRIWIKDTWYFIQLISGYTIGENALVEVDLVKVPAIAIPGPIPAGATGATGGTCRTISLCNNNTASEAGQATYTYVDCESNLQSVTLVDNSCAAPLCMLFPLINALPSGFTAADIGPCGVTGASLTLEIVNDVQSILIESAITTVEVQGSTGGTAGPYITIQNFTFNGEQDQNFFALVPNVPTGFGLKIVLSSSYAPGTGLVSQFISLATNGSTGATAGRSGTYQPISAIFPAVVNPSDTYTAYVNITY